MMYHSNNTASLTRTSLARLRPTQLTAGFLEVKLKTREWAKLGKRRRKVALEHHVFPAVIGPGNDYYIVDHHHLGMALLNEGIKDVFVAVLDDMSFLKPLVFWRTMEFRSWSHPYDGRGNRRDYDHMPKRLSHLEDDPYRSLAGLVRNAGGFAKDGAPFVEFLWADYFRQHVSARLINKDPERATRDGLKLAASAEARYLPGWSGKTPQ